MREAGGNATLKVYPGAGHAFDGDPDLTRLTRLRRAENFSACRVLLEPDGRLEYRGTHYAAGDRALMADMRRSCMTRGATVWTNPAQKAAATRDAIDFLDRTLAR